MAGIDPLEIRKAQFQAALEARHLASAVQSTRFIGVLFAAIGIVTLLAMWFPALQGRLPLYAIALVSTFLVAPGVLYVVAEVFLKARRYWAWLATAIITGVLLLAVGGVCLYSVVAMLAFGQADLGGPIVAFACWASALGVILFSLRQCLPAVRAAEQVVQKGFSIVPLAHSAAPADAGGSGSERDRALS
jgi:hypothetical protein